MSKKKGIYPIASKWADLKEGDSVIIHYNDGASSFDITPAYIIDDITKDIMTVSPKHARETLILSLNIDYRQSKYIIKKVSSESSGKISLQVDS